MRTVNEVIDRNIAAINARDLDTLLANQGPTIEFLLPGGLSVRGHDDVGSYTRTMWTALWAAFPDAAVTPGDQVLGDDRAATELIFTGTHTGAMQTPAGPIPPTGKRVTLHSVSIHRIENGLIAYEHVFADQLELMTQLGLPSAPAAT